jgi:hypothetical protein
VNFLAENSGHQDRTAQPADMSEQVDFLGCLSWVDRLSNSTVVQARKWLKDKMCVVVETYFGFVAFNFSKRVLGIGYSHKGAIQVRGLYTYFSAVRTVQSSDANCFRENPALCSLHFRAPKTPLYIRFIPVFV